MSAEQWRRIMAVNLLAPIQLFRELLPLLAAADEAHVVNVCSMFGLMPWRKAAAYQTSKYGLVGFTAALRAEFQRAHFGITALCPGFVRTALLDGQPGDRAGLAWISTTPEMVAARTIRAIRRNRGLVLVTFATQVYWRLYRVAPGLVDWLLREGWRRRGRIGS
jgi:3-oxoacyl-[acyl-carrier protein] reductase